MEINECRSAIKRKESFSFFLESSIAGAIAPRIFPRCGVPVGVIPVKILAINYFIPCVSFQIWLKDFGATFGSSLLFPHCFLKNWLSIKFFSFAPPFSIVFLFIIAFFQNVHIKFSVVPESFSFTESLRLYKSKLCKSIFTGQTSVHLPQREDE